jgi:hypothetical protein
MITLSVQRTGTSVAAVAVPVTVRVARLTTALAVAVP